MPVEVPARAGHRIAAVPAVAVHGPGRLLKESLVLLPTTVGGGRERDLRALERQTHETGGHLLDKGGGGHGEFHEEEGLGAGMELHGEGDVAATVAEEGSGDFPAEGGGDGEVRGYGEPLARGDDCGEREDVEEGT